MCWVISIACTFPKFRSPYWSKWYRFCDRLVGTLPLLQQSAYADADGMIDRYPELVACIVFVTARYVPSYESVRKSHVPIISRFLRVVLSGHAIDSRLELSRLQGLMILYAFARSNFAESVTQFTEDDDISFWSIKTTVEAYALQCGLHRTADVVRKELRCGRLLVANDGCVHKFLCWLWLYVTAHQYVLIHC